MMSGVPQLGQNMRCIGALVCPPGIVNVLRAPRDRDASPRKYHKCSKCRARMPLAVDAAAKHLTLWNRAGVHRVAYSTT